MSIINGRTLGDISGSYTCFQCNGRSTVDYIICSARQIKSFTLLKKTHVPCMVISDHAALTGIASTLEININSIMSSPTSDPENHKSRGLVKNFIWDSTTEPNFQTVMKLPHISQQVNIVRERHICQTQLDIDNYCEAIIKIYTTVAKLSMKAKTNQNKKAMKRKIHRLGYDDECHKAKKYVLHLGKQVTKNPKDPYIYEKFISTKKNQLIQT